LCGKSSKRVQVGSQSKSVTPDTGQNPSDPFRVESSFGHAQVGFWNEMEQTETKGEPVSD
jgi:hypothetical protein